MSDSHTEAACIDPWFAIQGQDMANEMGEPIYLCDSFLDSIGGKCARLPCLVAHSQATPHERAHALATFSPGGS